MTERFRPSAHLSWFAQRDALFLHHELTGRSLTATPVLRRLLATTPEPATVADRLAVARQLDHELDDGAMQRALELLCEARALVPEACLDECDALVDRVPVRVPWRVVQRDGDCVVVVSGRNLATEPTAHRLDEVRSRLWRAIDDERTIRSLAEATGVSLDEASAACHEWASSDWQLVRLSPVPSSFYRGLAPPAWLVSAMPFDRLEGDSEPARATEVIDLTSYHEATIQDAVVQFEHVETTLSHLFRDGHAALGGKTYAAALVDGLSDAGWLTEAHRAGTWLEVGGGLGYFARGVAEAATDFPTSFRYTIVDLSPALSDAQAARLEAFDAFDTRLDHAERLETVADASVDVLVSNEAIGDFTTVACIRRGGMRDGLDAGHGVWEDPEAMLDALEDDEDEPPLELDGHPDALAWIERADISLDDAPDAFLFNLGAFRFLEQVARVLRPGGVGCITEFGDLWRYPVESTHLDHAEVSIHFGQLLAGARALGLRAEVVAVPSLIELQPKVDVLRSTRTWFRNLQWLLGAHGVRIEKIATTPEAFETVCRDRFDPDSLEVLPFGPVGERIHGLVPHEFKALLVQRP